MIALLATAAFGTNHWFGARGLFLVGWAWPSATLVSRRGVGKDLVLTGIPKQMAEDGDLRREAWVEDGRLHYRCKPLHWVFDASGRQVKPSSNALENDAILAPTGFGDSIRISRKSPHHWIRPKSKARGQLGGEALAGFCERKGRGLLVAAGKPWESFSVWKTSPRYLERLASFKGQFSGMTITHNGRVFVGNYVKTSTSPDYDGWTTIWELKAQRRTPVRRLAGWQQLVDYRTDTGQMVVVERWRHMGDMVHRVSAKGKIMDVGDGGTGLAFPADIDFAMTQGWLGPLGFGS